ALGDSADIPRLVDTIPRVGYRFVGLVEGAPGVSPARRADDVPAKEEHEPRGVAESLPPRVPRRRWMVLAAGALVIAAVLVVLRIRPRALEPPGFRHITHTGEDWGPAASPDGRQVAFTSKRDGRSRIWLMRLGSGDDEPITSGPADGNARFSPDGASLLFTRVDAGIETLYRVPVSGGEPRRLLE